MLRVSLAIVVCALFASFACEDAAPRAPTRNPQPVAVAPDARATVVAEITAAATALPTETPIPTAPPTPTAAVVAEITAAATAQPTETPIPTAAPTPPATVVAEITATALAQPTPIPPSSPTSTATAAATNTPTATATPTATSTSTAAATHTPTPTPTATATFSPTPMRTPRPTETPIPTATSAPTPAPAPMPSQRIATQDGTIQLIIPAGATGQPVDIEVVNRAPDDFGAPPAAGERAVNAVSLNTYAMDGETPLEITYNAWLSLRFAMPAGLDDACGDGRARVYRVFGATWTPISHRCETDDAAGETFAAVLLNRFSDYVLTIAQTSPVPPALSAPPTYSLPLRSSAPLR